MALAADTLNLLSHHRQSRFSCALSPAGLSGQELAACNNKIEWNLRIVYVSAVSSNAVIDVGDDPAHFRRAQSTLKNPMFA